MATLYQVYKSQNVSCLRRIRHTLVIARSGATLRSVVITREGIASGKTLATTLAMPSMRYGIMYTPRNSLFREENWFEIPVQQIVITVHHGCL